MVIRLKLCSFCGRNFKLHEINIPRKRWDAYKAPLPQSASAYPNYDNLLTYSYLSEVKIKGIHHSATLSMSNSIQCNRLTLFKGVGLLETK
jgi:hypothetical protein